MAATATTMIAPLHTLIAVIQTGLTSRRPMAKIGQLKPRISTTTTMRR